MLEPTDLPDEYGELEKELSRPPAAELPQELQAKIMKSVHEAFDREEHIPQSPGTRATRSWVRLSVASFAAAAAVTWIVTLLVDQRVTRTKLSQVVGAPSVNEDTTSMNSQQQHSPTLPTLQHYRLALSESSADWEALLHRESDLFEDLSGDSQTIRWRQGTSSLQDD